MVTQALDSLPDDIAEKIENVEVVVEEEPAREALERLPAGGTLLGTYQGIPKTSRGYYHAALPDKITIYKGPIERMAKDPDRIREQVRKTVIHEVAHHFGIGDERLRELGWG